MLHAAGVVVVATAEQQAGLASLLGVAVVAVERHAIVVGDFLKHHGDEAEALSLTVSDLLIAPCLGWWLGQIRCFVNAASEGE